MVQELKRFSERVQGRSNRASECDSRTASSTTNAEHGEVSDTSAGEAYGPESRQTVTSQDELGEASNPSLGAPCVSQSQEETVISDGEVYFTSQTAQASETTMDDPDPKTHPRKRTSRLRNSRPRKRNTAGSSVLAAKAATTSGESSTTSIDAGSSSFSPTWELDKEQNKYKYWNGTVWVYQDQAPASDVSRTPEIEVTSQWEWDQRHGKYRYWTGTKWIWQDSTPTSGASQPAGKQVARQSTWDERAQKHRYWSGTAWVWER